MSTGVVLGLVDGLHDAGAALVRDGVLLAAANEERFTRRKLQGGWPRRSLQAVMAHAGVTYDDIAQVGVAGVATPTLPTRIVRPLQRMYARSLGICFDRPWHPVDRLGDLARYRLGMTRARPDDTKPHALLRRVLRRALPAPLREKPLAIVDHHVCHAESAARTAGEGAWLVVTADAHGDGRCWTVHTRDADGTLTLQHELDVRASLGAFYSYVTCTLGFRPGRHEGKVLGLAARGDASAVDRPFPFRWARTELVYSGRWGLRGMRDLRPLRAHRREDVAAWLQHHTQALVLEGVGHWLEQTDLRALALAGGLFANVAINGALARRADVDALHVFPHMGDGGLAAGVALRIEGVPPSPTPMATAALGPHLDAEQARAALHAVGLPAERPDDPDAILVDALAQGLPVVRAAGAMEFGPRALGHRSVLAPADDPTIAPRLNEALDRDDFMPFGPLVAAEQAATCFEGVSACAQALRFMTVALPAKPYFRSACPAAVHLDGTARPQVVVAREQPALHALLERYRLATGRPGMINTSFNRHEEPIVHNAQEAVAAFVQSGLPVMRLGPFVVRHPSPRAWRTS